MPNGTQQYDVIIVGAGPAGLSAALNCSSEGLSTIAIDSNEDGLGGQARDSALIENFMGFPKGVTGRELAHLGREQAARFGTKFMSPAQAVRLVQADESTRMVSIDDGTKLIGRTVLLATGVSYRRLEIDNLAKLVGCGVSYSPPSTTANFENKRIYIVGGANSAGQAAAFLAQQKSCEVHMVIRNEGLSASMSKYLIDRLEHLGVIKMHFNTQVIDAHGDAKLEKLTLQTGGERAIVEADHLFVFIGGMPRTEWLRDTVARDSKGFIETGTVIDTGWWKKQRPPFAMETSMPGVFAAGDVRHSFTKRISAAVGEGAQAIQDIHTYLALKAE